jgi:hypothetical protein
VAGDLGCDVADTNGWNEYQKLVLAELERLDSTTKQIQEDVTEIRLHVAVLRTRAVTWGALGGFIMWAVSLAASRYL